MANFSYLMCNFNHGRSLPRALAALTAEANPDDEIIVIDDGSTDDSPLVLERFVHGRSNMKFIRFSENRGLMTASATALSHARGRYVGLFAADDCLQPGFGARTRRLADKYPQAGVLVHEVIIRSPSHEMRRYRFGALRTSGYLTPDALSRIMKFRYFWISTAAAFLRRDFLEAAGGWRPELDWFADWHAAYDIAWKSGVAWAAYPGAEITENPNSFGRAGASATIRRQAALHSFFDLLNRDAYSGLRRRLRHAPIALLAAFGDDLPNLLANRAEDQDIRQAVTLCMRERARLGRIGKFAACLL